MSDSRVGPGAGKERKVYAVDVQAKAHLNISCAFCWLVINAYPTLEGMTETDSMVFRAHLRESHGLLVDEIRP